MSWSSVHVPGFLDPCSLHHVACVLKLYMHKLFAIAGKVPLVVLCRHELELACSARGSCNPLLPSLLARSDSCACEWQSSHALQDSCKAGGMCGHGVRDRLVRTHAVCTWAPKADVGILIPHAHGLQRQMWANSYRMHMGTKGRCGHTHTACTWAPKADVGILIPHAHGHQRQMWAYSYRMHMGTKGRCEHSHTACAWAPEGWAAGGGMEFSLLRAAAEAATC